MTNARSIPRGNRILTEVTERQIILSIYLHILLESTMTVNISQSKAAKEKKNNYYL